MSDMPDHIPVSPGTQLRPKTSPTFRLVQVLAVLGVLVLLGRYLVSVFRAANERAHRTECGSHLKLIGLALYEYHGKYNALPPAYTVDANGKPLHSWRTLLLPFLDEAPLYKSIDLSKPWNDPVNARAYASSVRSYQCPLNASSATETSYLAIVTPHSGIRPTSSKSHSEFTDGLGSTLLVIEMPGNRAVHWMSPVDADESLVLSIGPHTKLIHSAGVRALLGDGTLRTISVTMPDDLRRALISIDGNEPIGDY